MLPLHRGCSWDAWNRVLTGLVPGLNTCGHSSNRLHSPIVTTMKWQPSRCHNHSKTLLLNGFHVALLKAVSVTLKPFGFPRSSRPPRAGPPFAPGRDPSSPAAIASLAEGSFAGSGSDTLGPAKQGLGSLGPGGSFGLGLRPASGGKTWQSCDLCSSSSSPKLGLGLGDRELRLPHR